MNSVSHTDKCCKFLPLNFAEKQAIAGKSLFTKLALLTIGFYRNISFIFPIKCRYFPTCSEYSRQAFIRYGFFKAVWLSFRRLLRCHPFSRGGYDPLK